MALRDYQRGWYHLLWLHMARNGGSLLVDADLWRLAGAETRHFFEKEKGAVLACYESREVAGGLEIFSKGLLDSLELSRKLVIVEHLTRIPKLKRPYKRSRFTKPTLEEVKTYLEEKNSPIDAEIFWNHYESKGWVIGKSPMKSWHSAIVTWEKKFYREHPEEDFCRDPEHRGLTNEGRCWTCRKRKA